MWKIEYGTFRVVLYAYNVPYYMYVPEGKSVRSPTVIHSRRFLIDDPESKTCRVIAGDDSLSSLVTKASNSRAA